MIEIGGKRACTMQCCDMKRSELLSWLNAEGIRPDAYDLTGASANEAYVLRSDSTGWEVFYSERGRQTGRERFATESEACQHFRRIIEGDPTMRQHPYGASEGGDG